MEALSKPVLLLIMIVSGYVWYKLAKWVSKKDKENGLC